MKNLIFVSMVAFFLVSCQTKPRSGAIDLNATKDSVAKVMDIYNASTKARDVNAVISYFTDDLLYTGTDPKDFWNKTEIAEILNQMLSDTSVSLDYIIDKQEINMSDDGNSAMILEQLHWESLAGNIPFRIIFHAVKKNNEWKFDFVSANFILNNEDIAAINEVLEL